MKHTYLLVDFFSVLVPFLFSFHPKLNFHKYFKAFFISVLIVAALFLVWDESFAVKGVWGFNDKYIIGIKLFHLPIEEILFFICIPFACTFTFHCLNKFFKLGWLPIAENVLTIILFLFLLVEGILNIEKAYTASTFISTSLLLIILRFLLKADWLGKFYSVFPVLLIPFFIVNGILTGTGLEEPVVWYNNSENLGIRILSIPVEDIVYGLELLLLNLYFFILFKGTGSIKDGHQETSLFNS